MQHLLEAGYFVVATDLPNTKILPKRLNDANLMRIYGNITDLGFVFYLFKKMQYEYVVHVAAVVDISRSYEQIKDVNVTCVKFLYETSKYFGVRRYYYYSIIM